MSTASKHNHHGVSVQYTLLAHQLHQQKLSAAAQAVRLAELCQTQVVDVGATWDGFNAGWPSTRRERANIYGPNDMSIGRPSLPAMVAHAFNNPLFQIQV